VEPLPDPHFVPVPFADIQVAVRRHLAALPSAVDAFLEDHILTSRHYRIVIAGEPAGYASLHDGQLITQFALDTPYRRFGQPVFARLRRLEQAQSAFVPTGDQFFLAHALDDYRQLTKQAYFFAHAETPRPAIPEGVDVRPATMADLDLIRQESEELFAPIERYIASGELFVTLRDGEPAGFGIMVVSALYDDVASIGMYTIDRFRRAGVGTATLQLLIAECHRRRLSPVAGCWYYNHASKRTLERAGMHAPARLLKIDY
jgi:RimJ/RimL family protein N-acetyltransferase